MTTASLMWWVTCKRVHNDSNKSLIKTSAPIKYLINTKAQLLKRATDRALISSKTLSKHKIHNTHRCKLINLSLTPPKFLIKILRIPNSMVRWYKVKSKVQPSQTILTISWMKTQLRRASVRFLTLSLTETWQRVILITHSQGETDKALILILMPLQCITISNQLSLTRLQDLTF